MTCIDNIACGYETLSKNDATKALDMVNLQKVANQKGVTLSQGEKQRLSLARLLAKKPKIILCDEVTSNLDENNSSIIVSTLLSYAENNLVVFATHESNDLKMLSNKPHFVLENGRLVSKTELSIKKNTPLSPIKTIARPNLSLFSCSLKFFSRNKGPIIAFAMSFVVLLSVAFSFIASSYGVPEISRKKASYIADNYAVFPVYTDALSKKIDKNTLLKYQQTKISVLDGSKEMTDVHSEEYITSLAYIDLSKAERNTFYTLALGAYPNSSNEMVMSETQFLLLKNTNGNSELSEKEYFEEVKGTAIFENYSFEYDGYVDFNKLTLAGIYSKAVSSTSSFVLAGLDECQRRITNKSDGEYSSYEDVMKTVSALTYGRYTLYLGTDDTTLDLSNYFLLAPNKNVFINYFEEEGNQFKDMIISNGASAGMIVLTNNDVSSPVNLFVSRSTLFYAGSVIFSFFCLLTNIFLFIVIYMREKHHILLARIIGVNIIRLKKEYYGGSIITIFFSSVAGSLLGGIAVWGLNTYIQSLVIGNLENLLILNYMTFVVSIFVALLSLLFLFATSASLFKKDMSKTIRKINRE